MPLARRRDPTPSVAVSGSVIQPRAATWLARRAHGPASRFVPPSLSLYNVSTMDPGETAPFELHEVAARLKHTARRAVDNPRLWAFLIVILLDVVLVVIVGRWIVESGRYPFDSDEALHARRGLELALDLRRGRFGAFLRNSYSQSLYPPGYAWLEAVVFLALGPSTVAARACSLACLVAATFAVYGMGLELHPARGHLIGLIAVAFTLLSQYLLILSGLAMLETMGLAFSLASLWAYVRFGRHRGCLKWGMATSLLLVATMLVKYPFGIVTVLTVGLLEMIWAILELRATGPRTVARRWIGLFLPLLVALVIWFAGEGKLDDFVTYATLQPKQTAWYSWDNLIFYPRSFALHYLPSPALIPLVVAAIVWAIARTGRRALRVMVLYLLVGLIVFTAKESNNPRFIATVAPAAYLPLAALLAALPARAEREARTRGRWARLGLLLVVASLLVSVPAAVQRLLVVPDLLQVMYETDPRAHEFAGWIVERTHGRKTLLINPWDQFSRHLLDWYAVVHGSAPGMDSPAPTTAAHRLAPFTESRAESLNGALQAMEIEFVVLLEGGFEGHAVWEDYEEALATDLASVDATSRRMDLYLIEGWMKRSAVTRRTLEEAKARHHVPLTVRATIYRRWRSARAGATPGSSGAIDIGRPEDTLYIGAGWYPSERISGAEARWTGRVPTATLRVDLPPQQHVLEMRALAYPAEQWVTVRVNGREVSEVPLSPTWSVYTVEIPASVVGSVGPTELDLVHHTFASPSDSPDGPNADERMLAAAYDWVVIRPVP